MSLQSATTEPIQPEPLLKGAENSAVALDRVHLATLSVGHAVTDSYGHTLLAPMFPILWQRLQLGLDDIGTLPIMMGLTSSLAQPLIGLLTDRWPRIPAVALGPALAAIFMGLVSVANSYATLAAALFLAGIGIGAFHPQGAAAARLAARGRGLAMSAFTVGGNVGFGLAPVLGAIYFKWFGLERFYLASIPGVLFALWALLLLRPRTNTQPSLQVSDAGQRRQGNWRALWLLTGTVAVRAAVQIATITFMAFLLRDRLSAPGLDETDVAGISLSAFLLATAVAGPVGGHLSDRFGCWAVMMFSLAAAPFVFSAALYLPGYWMVFGLSAGGFVLMLPHPANVVMAQEYVPSNAGVAASMITGVAWAVGQMFSWPLGLVAEHIGLVPAMQIIYWLPALGVFLVLPLREKLAE